MFQITATAAAELRRVHAELDTRDDVCLRVGKTEEGVRVFLDRQRAGDKAIKDGDELLLVVDAATAEQLDDRTMNYDESAKQLVFT